MTFRSPVDHQDRPRRSTRNIPAIAGCQWCLDGDDAVRKLGRARHEYTSRAYGGGAVADERGRKSAVFTVSAAHPGGALAQLQMVHVLVSDRIVGGTPCQVVYVPSVNLMNLINDAGTDVAGAWVGPGGGSL